MHLKPTLLVALALTLPLAGARAATFTTNASLTAGDATYDGEPIVVSNCVLTVDGPHTFASLWLTNGAVLTHSPAPGGETNHRLLLTITGDATIATNCSVDVTARGYASASGPGAGCSNGSESGGGGGHGGEGGVSAKGCPGGGVYDSFQTPALHGSGGGNGYASVSGNGGGVIQLSVGGTLWVDGTITADGGSPISGNYGGGGAGGSISLTVDTLAGNGMIAAHGGNGSNVGGGGGGEESPSNSTRLPPIRSLRPLGVMAINAVARGPFWCGRSEPR